MTTPNAMYANSRVANPLIDDHVDLVKRIAYRLHSRLPDSVQIEDLIQAGMLGLLEAHERFREEEGASFSTFAGIRIRGAMVDEIRRGDWAPRSLHRKSRAVAEAQRVIEIREGRPATDAEVAKELGMTAAEYRKTIGDVASAHLHSLDDGDPDMPQQEVAAGDDWRPAFTVERDSLFEAVACASDELPDRERALMSMYYDQDLNLREIAESLGVSESRACQLHGRAISRVRDQLTAWAA
jgi:RNA polymerase sigma factor for flagellar operon FliA